MPNAPTANSTIFYKWTTLAQLNFKVFYTSIERGLLEKQVPQDWPFPHLSKKNVAQTLTNYFAKRILNKDMFMQYFSLSKPTFPVPCRNTRNFNQYRENILLINFYMEQPICIGQVLSIGILSHPIYFLIATLCQSKFVISEWLG